MVDRCPFRSRVDVESPQPYGGSLDGAIVAAWIEASSSRKTDCPVSIQRLISAKTLPSVGRIRLIEDPIMDVLCLVQEQFQREELLRFDLLIDKCLFVEVKAIEAVQPVHKAQLLNYMKLLDIPLGLIINFNELKLTDGISRLILPGANRA